MANRESFAEKETHPKSHWNDVLNGEKIAVSEANLEPAIKGLREFKRQNLEGYHNVYLKCNTLILACVFEAF